jgi:hypothetical protein
MKADIDKKIKSLLIFMIIISVLAVVGIPCIPIGFANNMLWLGIPGIVFAVAGFYGAPIGWTQWGALVQKRNVARAIELDGLTEIADLARNFGKSPKVMKAEVLTVINKRYITGYKLNEDGTALVPIVKKEKSAPKKINTVCDFCGAQHEANEDGYCTYCGTHYKIVTDAK